MPSDITAAELLALVTKLKIEDSYARAAEELATLTDDKLDDAIRRRVADADATPKLRKLLEVFLESIDMHASSLKEKAAKEVRCELASALVKTATDALDAAEEKQAKAGDSSPAEAEENRDDEDEGLLKKEKEKAEPARTQRGKAVQTALEAKTEAERMEKKTIQAREAANEHEEALLIRKSYLEMAASSALQVLINLSRSKPNRLLIDQCGCIKPACALLNMTMRREVFERAVMLLINCSTGPEMAPVHANILEAGGVSRLVEMLKLGPTQTTAHRAIQVLSLVSLNDGVKDAFREADGGFGALAAMLGAEKDGLYVKHAALCGNHLCEMNIPNKLAFMEHGCIPPMMALIKHGPTSPLTDIVVHTITSLAVGNELCDPVITNSGPLPYLVDLISNEANPKLTLPAVTAVMHMAREDVDAKQILTLAGVIPKLKLLVNKDNFEDKHEAKVIEKAVSALSNLANNSPSCQAELTKEGVLDNIKGMLQVVHPNTKLAQVLIAFCANFALNSADNGTMIKDADMLPLIAFHHLNGRAMASRESKAALVALGSVVNEVQESADLISGMFSEILLHECLEGAPDGTVSIPENLRDEMAMFRNELSAEMEKMRAKFRGKSSKLGIELGTASNNMMIRVTGRKSIKAEVKEMDAAKKLREKLAEAQTLEDVTLLAGASKTAGDFAPLARKAWDTRRTRAAKDATDIEATRVAAEAEVEQQAAANVISKDKEMKEADEAREDLRRAQADAAKSKAAAIKEVSEAKAAKKDWEAATKAVQAKRDHFDKEKLKADKAIMELRESYTLERAAKSKEVKALESDLVGATEDRKLSIEVEITERNDTIQNLDRRMLPDGCPDIQALQLQAAELEAAKTGAIISALEDIQAEKKANYDMEQQQADEAAAAREAALETEQDAKMSAKRETKEARMEDLRTVKAAKELAKKKERLAAGLSAESVLGQKKKLQSECCIVM